MNFAEPISANKSWFFRNTEEDVIPEEKVIDVAANAFEKAKASARYGIMDEFKFVVYLPLKALFVELSDEQARDLGLYNQHTKLCLEIQKVRSVFWRYHYAQEDVIEAMNETESTDCRDRAFIIGNELVKMYNDLIELAITQAADRHIDITLYLNDLHNELNRSEMLAEKDIPLYKTVNMIRAIAVIESSFQKKSLADLKSNYLNFVTDFVSNMREAFLFSGNTSVSEQDAVEITNAFILGLSTIPEFGEGLALIELYNELTKQQKSLAAGQNDGLQYFQEQLEYLMKRDRPIEHVNLERIQYKGISLLSVMNLDVEQLNQLKKLKENLQNVQSEIERFNAAIVEDRQLIAQPVDYSFNDVQVFLNEHAVDGSKLEGIPNEDTALGRLSTAYAEAFKEHADLTKLITESTEIQVQAKTARTQEIAQNQEEVTGCEEEIQRLNIAIGEGSSVLQVKRKELRVLQEGIAEKEKKLASEKEGSDQLQNALNKGILSSFKKDSAALVQPLEDEVDKLQTDYGAKFDAWKIQHNRLTELKNVQTGLVEADDLQNQADDLLLQGLNEQLEGVKARKIGKLSGEDVKALAISLGVVGNAASENSLARQLNTVLHVEDKVERSTKSLAQSKIEVETIQQQVDALEDAMFSEDKKSVIATQLKANLVIAKKVTFRVGREIVARQEKAFSRLVQKAGRHKPTSSQDEYAQVSLIEKQACQGMVSQLEVYLNQIEKMDGDASNLNGLVNLELKIVVPDANLLVLDPEEDSDRDPEKEIV